jgi:hypothetical protein
MRHDLTADSSLLSTDHGRQRREERNIAKIYLQSARRYGMEDTNHTSNKKYIYGGKVFIYNPMRNCEVTSFPSSDAASTRSGTKCVKPILLEPLAHYQGNQEIEHYKKCRDLARVSLDKWTSHTVLVIDMSGSMRRDDVNGARCRSDGVWLVLARDLIKKQLEAQTATLNDVVSVIIMQDEAKILLSGYPMHWVLYNHFLSFREYTTLRPRGPGNYLPALALAEQVLRRNPSGKCSLSLMFVSDGKPSDYGPFADRVGSIASKFGRRLSVYCIGMADDTEDFSTLQEMVTEAEHFGAVASFHKPTLGIDSLSNIISSLVTSLNSSKTEMTDLKTGSSRSVRVDLRRERKGAPDDVMLTDDWEAFRMTSDSHYITDIWTWDYRRDDFVTVMNPNCSVCFGSVADIAYKPIPGKGVLCPGCKACFFCHACTMTGLRKHFRSYCAQYTKHRRIGHFAKEAIPSWSMAIKKLVYGEGAERIVYKVRFLDDMDRFFGPKMVAKESRFIEPSGEYVVKREYHKEFTRAQTIASELADKFNETLDALKDHVEKRQHFVVDGLPRIRFLKPLVVEAVGGSHDGEPRNFLIEEQLEGEYKKFNNNMGFVRGDGTVGMVQHKPGLLANNDGLGAIVEESEDEDEDDDDDGEIFESKQAAPDGGKYGHVKVEDFPQAFSHFTYVKTKKQLMVVDLQGVFKVHANKTTEYVLTDPAIHKRRRPKRKNQLAGWTFGRTDRGEKGMQAFFDSHECSDACRLLGLENHRKRRS